MTRTALQAVWPGRYKCKLFNCWESAVVNSWHNVCTLHLLSVSFKTEIGEWALSDEVWCLNYFMCCWRATPADWCCQNSPALKIKSCRLNYQLLETCVYCIILPICTHLCPYMYISFPELDSNSSEKQTSCLAEFIIAHCNTFTLYVELCRGCSGDLMEL